MCARACSGRQAKFYLDVIGLVVEGDEGAHNTLENGPEQEGKEEGQVHDVAADGRRQKDERQAVPVHAAQICSNETSSRVRDVATMWERRAQGLAENAHQAVCKRPSKASTCTRAPGTHSGQKHAGARNCIACASSLPCSCAACSFSVHEGAGVTMLTRG
jgi:hypothetical protein